MGKDELFHFSEDLDGIGAGFDKQLKQGENEKLSQSLKKARVLCIRERFDEALKIYESIVDEDIECVAGYIGILRVHSKDYTVFDGAEIEKDIKVIDKIGDGTEADDDEYVDYLKKRKEYLSKKTAVPVAPAKPAPGAPAAPENPAPIETAKPTLPDGILSKEEAWKLFCDSKYDKITVSSVLYYAEQADARFCYAAGFMYLQNDITCLGYDEEKAFYWLKKSAEAGYATGQGLLGHMYDLGKGVSKDYGKAAYWMEQGAEQGDGFSLNNIIYYYRNGIGVPKDDTKVAYFIQKKAEKGFEYSQCELADCYYKGKGVAKDIDKAIYWYEKAAAQGNADAKAKLAKLKK